MAFAATGCDMVSQSNTSTSAETSFPTGSLTAQISWTANRETAVNTTGGGYKVYYSRQSGFSLASAQVVNVPYVSGTSAPTSTTLTSLASGTYYIKVVAYSTLAGNQVSAPSAQTSIELQ